MNKFIITTILQLVVFSVIIVSLPSKAVAFNPFGGTVCNQTDSAGNKSAVCATDGTKDPISGKDGVITKIADIFALITGIAAIVMIIIGGFEYVRSGGESSKISKAKNTILFAIIGLVVVVVARSIVVLVVSKL